MFLNFLNFMGLFGSSDNSLISHMRNDIFKNQRTYYSIDSFFKKIKLSVSYDSFHTNRFKSNFADIDECADLRGKNNCSTNSVCINTAGSYNCRCKRGMTGDGKTGPCTEKFPSAAKAAVGKLPGSLIRI